MSTTNIETACNLLQTAWPSIKNQYFKANPGKYLILTTVYRSPAEQYELFKQGRKALDSEGHWEVVDKDKVVTNVDGYKILGAHNYNPSRAIDVAVVDNQTGKTLWDEIYYHSLIEIAQGLGLISGGSWNSIKDWQHLEIPFYKTNTGE